MQIKENLKAPPHWPLCGDFTGDRWIPRTNVQLRGKCFHLMASSWSILLWQCTWPNCHHQIDSVTHFPLFKVRPWNNALSCLTFYIFIDAKFLTDANWDIYNINCWFCRQFGFKTHIHTPAHLIEFHSMHTHELILNYNLTNIGCCRLNWILIDEITMTNISWLPFSTHLCLLLKK